MATNFSYLLEKREYEVFAQACVDAENILYHSPALSAVGSRKALELAVKWVYSADDTIHMPYKDNLQSLLHETSFRWAVDRNTWEKLRYIVRIGNESVHTSKRYDKSNAMLSLSILFEFIQWLDYCYGKDYKERKFDEELVPVSVKNVERVEQELSRFREESEQIISEKDKKIEELLAKVAEMSKMLTANKDVYTAERAFVPEDLTEFETRKRYIDFELKEQGWELSEDGSGYHVKTEFPVTGMPSESGKGAVDYVLYSRNGTIIGLIEAKKSLKDPNVGKHQAWLYANCIEEMTGKRPIIFNTNGFDTYIWDDKVSPQRRISGILCPEDLQRLYNKRDVRKSLKDIRINDDITDRYYQKQAVRAVCENIEEGHMRSLLVMATGTGKTRTAASLTDVLSRGKYVTNTLFLADRIALVEQAKEDFKKYLPDMSLCNLLSNKDDKNARIVFSTYPTILNAIDQIRKEDGRRLFSQSHFDLIIVDEAHRSIFKKYKAIFEYFDAYVIGLTATPRKSVHASTYDFFEMQNNVPTFVYDYDTAVNKDHVLVPFHNIEVSTKILRDGMKYDELPEEDKERYEEDFTEDGEIPEEIPPEKINKCIFNQDTVDHVLNDLMTNGLRDASGNRVGKTIIFAQNKAHAQYIVERFDKLYPKLGKEGFCQRVVCTDSYVQDLIKLFKSPDKEPHIVVSVDMLDTGVDVPEIVNLVFFKIVRSKIKFWQMIGRGTRLRPGLLGEGRDKTQFYIFDYLGNFEYFRESKHEKETTLRKSYYAEIFSKRVQLISCFQNLQFDGQEYQTWRDELIDIVYGQITELERDRIDVKLQRKYLEKFSQRESFRVLSNIDKTELINNLADLVAMDDDDDAVGFDNLMYGLMLSVIRKDNNYIRYKNQCIGKITILASKMNIPFVKRKENVIRKVLNDMFWENLEILQLEQIRKELRDVMKFAKETGRDKIIYTNITDAEITRVAGKEFDMGEDFEDYRIKVNRYIEENKNHIAIQKLRMNKPLTQSDYRELEYILTDKLGTREEYERNFHDTPFGLLVRKIAKLDREAAMKAFSKFQDEQNLTSAQMVFVEKVIDYVAGNGYIDDVLELTKAPFDKPIPFVKLFTPDKQKEVVRIVNEIKDNAIKIIG